MGFGDKFAKFSTFTMQKLGKSKPIEEDETFTLMLNNLGNIKRELENMLALAKHMQERMCKIGKSYHQFGACISTVDCADGKNAINSLVPLLTKIADSENKLAEEFKVSVVLAIENLLSVHVSSAYSARKRYESSKLDYETCQNRFQSVVDKKNAKPEDIDNYKQKTDAAQVVYEDARGQLIDSLTALDAERANFFNNNMGRIVSTLQLYGTEVATEASNYNN